MTDDPDDRIFRLNAALDGELDPIRALELERDLRADPALAAEYRRLEALRQAIGRHAPREGAPKALIERVAALTEPAAPPSIATFAPARRPLWSGARALALAASFAVLGFAVGVGVTTLRMPSASQGVAESLVSDFARAAIAGRALRRRIVRPAYPETLARRPHHGQRVDRRSREPRLPARRRARRRRRSNSRARPSSIAMANISSPSPSCRSTPGARAPAAGSRRSTAIMSRAGRTRNLAYVAVSDMDEKTLGEFVAAFRQAEKPAEEGQ